MIFVTPTMVYRGLVLIGVAVTVYFSSTAARRAEDAAKVSRLALEQAMSAESAAKAASTAADSLSLELRNIGRVAHVIQQGTDAPRQSPSVRLLDEWARDGYYVSSSTKAPERAADQR